MSWMLTIGDFWLNTLGWLMGLAAAFGILDRLMPCNPGMHWWKDLRAVATDLLYWFVAPLFLQVGRTIMLVGAVALLCGGRDPQLLPVRDLPLWLQCVAILLIQDVMLYWSHRVFHTPLAWKFHAIHHSPKVLDWMATKRTHAVNYLLEFGLADVAVLLMGFSPAALLVLAPFTIIYSAMVHANLNWTFGPLRYVFASPVFHRWHHTTLEEGLDKNFASTFPILDVIFGTFYMPPGTLPEHFGTGDPNFPDSFWGQFIHPFRKSTQHAIPSQPRDTAAAGRAPASGRPALAVACILGVVSVVAGGAYFMPRVAERNEQVARAAEQVNPQQSPAATARPAGVTGHTGAVLSVAISADGKRIVSGSEGGTVKVWDAATDQETLTLSGHTRPVRSVAISADGQRIASGSDDRTVKVWDAGTSQAKLTLSGHLAGVGSVAISPDGKRIISGSADGALKVWDALTGEEKLSLPLPAGAVLSVAVSADGRQIVAAKGETVKVWDAQTGQEQHTLAGHADLVCSVAISANGQRIASGSHDEKVKVWDAVTGEELLTVAGHTGPVYSVAISADGQRIVSGRADGAVTVWDMATGRETCTLTGHTDAVTSVAISANGQRIVSGSRDGTVKVWDAQNGAFREKVDLTWRD